MFKTYRCLFNLASFALCSAAVEAAPPVNAGHLYLNGNIAAASCMADPLGSGNFNIGMGHASFDDIGTFDLPNMQRAVTILIGVVCPAGATGLDTVHMTFRPEIAGSGLDPDEPRLVANTGSASGLGFAIVKSDDTLLDFQAEEAIDAKLKVVGDTATATLEMRIAHIRTGAALIEGNTSGSVPFLLTYE